MAYNSLSNRDDAALPSESHSPPGAFARFDSFLNRVVGQLQGSSGRLGPAPPAACYVAAGTTDYDPDRHTQPDNHQSHRSHGCRFGTQRTSLYPDHAAARSPAAGPGVNGADGFSVCIAADYKSEGPSLPFDAVKYGAAQDIQESDSGDSKVDMQRLFNKISARLLPLFFIMVIMCYVDRTSLAFAAIQLNADLKFAPSVYGMGSGLFFLGYSLFQVPSNLLLRRFGGPAWLAGIIAAWGLVASAFAGMSTAAHFYALRLMLGVTEAGAFPGMWYVLTTFFPGDQITFPFAVVEAGISLSHVVAAPLAAACLSLDGMAELAGWRWLFLLEGLPTLVLAVFMYRLLPRSPDTADFLTPCERKALNNRIESHDRSGHSPIYGGDKGGGSSLKSASNLAGGHNISTGVGGNMVKRSKARVPGEGSGPSIAGSHPEPSPLGLQGASSGASSSSAASSWHAVRLAVNNRYVWYLGALKFVRDIASFGLIFWAPTIVNSLLKEMREASSDISHDQRRLLGGMPMGGHSTTGTAAVLLTALPFALAAICGMGLAHSSQRSGEKCLHVGIPYTVAGVILTLYAGAANRSPWLGFAALSIGVIGVYCGSGPCLSLLSELAAGQGLVVALPLYNSLGTLGGFVGPSLVGWLVQRATSGAASASAGSSSTAAAIHGGGFGISAVVLGSALCLAGVMMLTLGLMLGRPGGGRDASGMSVIHLGGSSSDAGAGHDGLGGSGRGEAGAEAARGSLVDDREAVLQVSGTARIGAAPVQGYLTPGKKGDVA